MVNNYVVRDLESKIIKYLRLPQIIALLGPRRSGKTTFLKHLAKNLKNSFYLSFDNQKILDLFDLNIDEFADLYLAPSQFLILDEFQYSKYGGKNLKYLYDNFPAKKIIISGSSSPDLTIKALKYLVGRVVVLTLLPFNFEEFLRASDSKLFLLYKKGIKKDSPLNRQLLDYFEEFVLYGGYPEIVLEDDVEIKKSLLQNIYSLFFLKEVRDLSGLSDDYKLKDLLTGLSLSAGNMIEYRELSQVSGFDFRSVKKYLNFLEKTYITFLVRPFFKNKRTELTKNPKVYFYDSGLRNVILDNFLSLDKRVDTGALVENFVAVTFAREYKKLNFWRSKSKAEVDFVIEAQGVISGVEVKRGEETNISSSLRSFITKYQPDKCFILNKEFGKSKKLDKTQIYFLPYWKPGSFVGVLWGRRR